MIGRFDFEGQKSYHFGMTRSVVSDKGQITIPKPLRDSLGIRAGTELRFEEKDGALVAVPVVPTDPIDALVGLGDREDVDLVLAAARGPAYDPDLDGR